MNPKNIYFLYDISMLRFLTRSKKYNFLKFQHELKIASQSFLWFYKKIKSTKDLLGYDVFFDTEVRKYKINLIFDDLEVEVRVPWIQELGVIISQYHQFENGKFFVACCDHNESIEKVL